MNQSVPLLANYICALNPVCVSIATLAVLGELVVDVLRKLTQLSLEIAIFNRPREVFLSSTITSPYKTQTKVHVETRKFEKHAAK
ncbi:hypothetical protein C2L65_36475 [Paraburkholderia terrae]|uniref:Uncharacterized protein n=1 Tax=Paraburkholderia terrae TaxID=311230 RepID=A0A2I8EZQ6_9BURK|nr:hypothetical protein C2L65_36475 [Paraburkholderia terrae]